MSTFLPFALALMVPAMTAAAPALSVAPLQLPPVTEKMLPNGLEVVTVEKRDLPLVSIRLVIPTGSARDPRGKEGLAGFTGSLLRRGTATREADAIDDAIESIGGLMGVDVGVESTAIGVTVPAEHAATALEILADLAMSASFPESEVDLARRREVAQLRQDLDEPSVIADRAIARFFYGDAHPYAHPIEGSASTVKTFTRDDVVRFRDATFTPRGAVVFLGGDVTPKAAEAMAERFLGSWSGPSPEPLQVTQPGPSEGVEILLVDKPDATQAQIRVAVPGLARPDPRYYAATVANTVVGGGFTSRLVDEVRVNRGLSYTVSTRVNALRSVGAISYTTFTRNASVREILDVSFGVLDGFIAEGPTADELDKSKRYVIGLYPGRVESLERLVEALASMRLVGLPFSTVGEFRDRIAAATHEEVAAVARMFPSSKGARVVVVGKADEIRPQLEGLGTIRTAKLDSYE